MNLTEKVIISSLQEPTIRSGFEWLSFESSRLSLQYVRFSILFFHLDNLLSINEKDQFWQIPTSFPDWTNQNGENQICSNRKNKAKILHTVLKKNKITFFSIIFSWVVKKIIFPVLGCMIYFKSYNLEVLGHLGSLQSNSGKLEFLNSFFWTPGVFFYHLHKF